MYQKQISALASFLAAASEDDADNCESMYMAQFRSIPKLACEVFTNCMDEFYDYFDCEYSPELQIVELCNYKGEGEGFALFEDAKHLPVFRSKTDSCILFGA